MYAHIRRPTATHMLPFAHTYKHTECNIRALAYVSGYIFIITIITNEITGQIRKGQKQKVHLHNESANFAAAVRKTNVFIFLEKWQYFFHSTSAPILFTTLRFWQNVSSRHWTANVTCYFAVDTFGHNEPPRADNWRAKIWVTTKHGSLAGLDNSSIPWPTTVRSNLPRNHPLTTVPVSTINNKNVYYFLFYGSRIYCSAVSYSCFATVIASRHRARGVFWDCLGYKLLPSYYWLTNGIALLSLYNTLPLPCAMLGLAEAQ